MNTFLGSKDAVSLTYASKLKLNAHNNDFYQSRLLQLSIHPSSASLNDSCKLMLSAFKYYDEQIAKSDYLKSAEDISKFIEETIGEKILFIQISVADEISAYTMFETLNARRLELTATDLLKNYLFSLVKSDIDINNLNSQWETIVNTVGVNQLPKFLRYYLNSYQPLIRTDRLFKEIKKQIIEQNQVFPLLNKMQDFADIYTAIDDYENDIWKKNKDMRDLIREINLYNAEQHKSLVMAAYFNLSESEFIKVLRILKALIFRYTVIAGLNPNDLEKIYNKTAIKISNKKIQDAAHIFTELKPVYLETEYFINSFSTKTFKLNNRTKKLVRYILLSIENQRYCTSYSVLDSDASIEHILPENPNEEWENFFKGDTIQSYIARLGNLSLLEEKLNTKDAADKIFEEYSKSNEELLEKINKIDAEMLNIGFYKDKNTAFYKDENIEKDKLDKQNKFLNSYGLEVVPIEDGFVLTEKKKFYYNLFKNFVTNDYREFLRLYSEEDIDYIEYFDKYVEIIADRIVAWEKFLEKYPDSNFRKMANDIYQEYRRTYIFGLTSSETRESLMNGKANEAVKEFNRFIKKYPNSPTSDIIKYYLENYKEEDIDTLISKKLNKNYEGE